MSNTAKFRHEINNYLSVIYSELQSLEEKHQILARDQDWITMKQDTVQLSQMVNATKIELSSAKPENSSSSLQKKSADGTEELLCIHSLLQSLSHSWKLRYSRKGFRLTYINQSQESLKMKGTPFEIVQIFNNLLSNSYDSLLEKKSHCSRFHQCGTSWFPEATLILSHNREQILIQLFDNGCGISAEQLPHIFEYGRTSKTDGHGIGLSVVEELVKKHNGQIHVQTKEDCGCTFFLSFPTVSSVK
jgi:signal transduction histidine kinase